MSMATEKMNILQLYDALNARSLKAGTRLDIIDGINKFRGAICEIHLRVGSKFYHLPAALLYWEGVRDWFLYFPADLGEDAPDQMTAPDRVLDAIDPQGNSFPPARILVHLPSAGRFQAVPSDPPSVSPTASHDIVSVAVQIEPRPLAHYLLDWLDKGDEHCGCCS